MQFYRISTTCLYIDWRFNAEEDWSGETDLYGEVEDPPEEGSDNQFKWRRVLGWLAVVFHEICGEGEDEAKIEACLGR